MRLSALATGSVRMIRYVDFFLAYRMSENWFAQYISKRGFKFILLIVLKKEKKNWRIKSPPVELLTPFQ